MVTSSTSAAGARAENASRLAGRTMTIVSDGQLLAGSLHAKRLGMVQGCAGLGGSVSGVQGWGGPWYGVTLGAMGPRVRLCAETKPLHF